MNIVGRVIGNRYEILEKIGEGGMATVYKARDNVLKRYVAVKVLRDEFTTDEEFIKRFNTEAQSAASLTHPNIVSIFDVGHEENIYYIVMELVQGKTLKEIVSEDGVLPWKWSINIAIQVASALETAHKNNIVHRDIKPHNIIITEEGIAKVTDFGIAKAVSNSTITAFGTTIGSVHYFSPEHARGGYTDAKSDIYSLGVVMYEMLTGRVPFDADTPVSIALKHMQEKPVEPIKLNPSIPYAINKIIMKAMEKEISLRYQNATELLKDLSLALKNPDGNFVTSNAENMQYTQRVPTINENMDYDDEEESNMQERRKEIPSKNSKKKKIWITVAIICALIIIPVAGYFISQMVANSGQPKYVDIPNLVGKTLDEAKEELEKTKLTIEVESEVFDEEAEVDEIISQTPEFKEGDQLEENSTVKVVISKGQEIVEMKKVVGMKFEEAEKILKDELHLEVEKIEETSKTVEEGYVIKQSPEEGTELKAGETVNIHVSTGTGIKQVVVPHVLSDTEEEAKKKLADLKVLVVYEEDMTKVNGTVLKQSITAGETVDEKTEITLTVNKIQEIKTGTIILNLKSLLKYEAPAPSAPTTPENTAVNGVDGTNSVDTNVGSGTTGATQTEEAPKVRVQIIVDDKDTIFDEEHRKDETNITAQVAGKGTVGIKVLVDGIVRHKSQFDLTVDNPVLTID